MRDNDLLTTSQFYEFGVFRLDAGEEQLFVDTEPVRLAPKLVKCLILLVEGNGRTINKDEFFEKVWTDTFVEDNALSYTISQLRKTLAEFDSDGKYIDTIPRRGFRFVAEVKHQPVSKIEEIVLSRHSVEEVWLEESIDTAPTLEADRQPRSGSGRRFNLIWLLPVGLVLVIAAGVWLYPKMRPRQNAVVPSQTSPPAAHTSFAADEKVTTDFGYKVEKARAVALQPDGKIVVGGWAGDNEGTSDLAIARYGADGQLDQTFSGDGKVITEIGPLSDVIYAVAVQDDGKILAAGVSFGGDATRRFCVVRYKTDGALDAAFDGDGVVTMNVGTAQRDTAYAIAVQPDGKIVIAGSASNFVSAPSTLVPSNDFALVRLNADGSRDPAFGTDGAVTTNFGNGVDIAYAVAVQLDGKIVAAGTSTNGSNNDFTLARYNPDGTLDQTFGSGGRVRTDFFAGDDMITSMALQTDGKIVVAGYALKSTVADFASARYTPDGSLDNGFNGNGKVTLDIDDGYDVALGIRLQTDGKIVLGGQANIRSTPEMALVRLGPDGRTDESFGEKGKARIAFETPGEAWGLVLLPDSFALLVGSTGDSKISDFVLARYPID